MKTKHIYLFLSLFTMILFACDPETKEEKVDALIEDANNAKYKNVYTDAIEYNDAIIGLQAKIVIEILNFMPMNDLDSLRRQVGIIQKEILSSTEILEGISCSKDKNNKFKNQGIVLFNHYKKGNKTWEMFLEHEDTDGIESLLDFNDENMSENLNSLSNSIIEIEGEGARINEDFLTAQQFFAKEAGIMMSTEENPLNEEIDKYE